MSEGRTYIAVGGVERCSDCRQMIQWCQCPPMPVVPFGEEKRGVCMGCGWIGSPNRDTCPNCGDILLTIKRGEIEYA